MAVKSIGLGSNTYSPVYDNEHGSTGTALAGNTQWTLQAYRDTGLILPFLNRGQDDFFFMFFEFSHRRKLQTALGNVHIHLIPMAASSGNLYWSWSHTWVSMNNEVPAIVSWISGNTTTPIAAADQFKVKEVELFTGVTPPANETEDSIFITKVSRLGTNLLDTYDGNADGGGAVALNVAILFLDCATLCNRHGSTVP